MRRARPFIYFAKQAWLQLVRDRALTGTAVLANVATFFVSVIFLMIAFNLDAALESIRDRREVQVFLRRDQPPDGYGEIGKALGEIEGVGETMLITPEQALREFEKEFGESGLVEALGENPLPPTYRIRPREGYRTPEAIAGIASGARSVDGVESVSYGAPGIAKIEARVRTLAVVNLLVGLLVGGAAVLVVANTIKLTVIARKDLVEILKLVGATDGFVRWPFLLEGAMQGLIAGGVALLVLRGLHLLVSLRLAGILFFSALTILLFLVFAACLGAAGAHLACDGPLRGRWGRQ